MSINKHKTLYVCELCGSQEIQVKMWISINNSDITSPVSDGEIEDNWCPSCHTHPRIITQKEFTRNKREHDNNEA